MRSPRQLAGWLCLLLAALPAGRSEAAAGFELEAAQEPTAWTVLYQGKKVLVYSFAPQKFKPYVKELYTLSGHNILRDAPFDHLHHHALMYGVQANGINFWEEASGSGVQKPIQTSKPVLGFAEAPGGRLPQAQFTQVLHWIAPQDAFLPDTTPAALLIEHRTLTLTVNPALQEVALEWQSQFQLGARTNTVTLTGANYHGLGLRFLQDLDPLAVHSLAGVRPDLANGHQDTSAAPWASVSFDAPGWAATVALAGHPSNLRGDAVFFSMLTPFAYLSATQRLNREPLVFRAGETFQLHYLVLLYPDTKPSESLRQHIEAWRKTKL